MHLPHLPRHSRARTLIRAPYPHERICAICAPPTRTRAANKQTAGYSGDLTDPAHLTDPFNRPICGCGDSGLQAAIPSTRKEPPTDGPAAHTSAAEPWTALVAGYCYRAADLGLTLPHLAVLPLPTSVLPLPTSLNTTGASLACCPFSDKPCARGTAMLPAWYTASPKNRRNFVR
jgi:hypothetical protein